MIRNNSQSTSLQFHPSDVALLLKYQRGPKHCANETFKMQLCGETGATVDAKTQRDPLFRAASDAAAHDASEQTNQLGGQTPGKFLSGLANDLGPSSCNLLLLFSPERLCKQSMLLPDYRTQRRLECIEQYMPRPVSCSRHYFESPELQVSRRRTQ